MADQRKAFEEFIRTTFDYSTEIRAKTAPLSGLNKGDYVDSYVQSMWQSWQESRRQAMAAISKEKPL